MLFLKFPNPGSFEALTGIVTKMTFIFEISDPWDFQDTHGD